MDLLVAVLASRAVAPAAQVGAVVEAEEAAVAAGVQQVDLLAHGGNVDAGLLLLGTVLDLAARRM